METQETGITVADVATSIATESTCLPDRADAIDIDVTVTLSDGRTLDGEVTLVHDHDGRVVPYGVEPSHWVSGDLLTALRRTDGLDLGAALEAIADAALAEVRS